MTFWQGAIEPEGLKELVPEALIQEEKEASVCD